MAKSKAVADGLVALVHDGGGTSCSWGGKTYEADADGRLIVPEGAIGDLASHGWTQLVSESEAEPQG